MILREVIPDVAPSDIESASEAEELHGKMGSDPEDERLAHSVLENDDQTVRDGQLLAESVDYALGSFTPDMMFEELVQRYRNAQHLYGPTVIRELTGYDSRFIEKNLKIPEFREKLKEGLQKNIDRLKEEGLLDKEGKITEEGLQLASLVLYTEELDHLQTRGIGRKETKERAHYGERAGHESFRKHRYKDLDIKASLKRAMRRGHKHLVREDLVATRRTQHGKISIMYALDASGSMKGAKLHISKKAGIALAFKAIEDGNDVGLVIFTSKVEKCLPPTRDFSLLLRELTCIRAGHETDISLAVEQSTHIFPKTSQTKHLVLITDALPTRGDAPGKTTMDAVANAKDAGITLSLIGINLEKEGEKLAKRMVELGGGKLYRVKNLDELDLIVLEDYELLKN